MKKCPYCAELIQNEAILCRFCGREIITIQLQNIQLDSKRMNLEISISKIFTEISQIIHKNSNQYPLSLERRPDIIAKTITIIESKEHESLEEIINQLAFYWRYLDEDFLWEHFISLSLGTEIKDSDYPTEDEWLSSVASILIRSIAGNYAPKIGVFNYIDTWKSIQKTENISRFLKGFSLLGAISNIIGTLATRNIPKKGSFEWNVYRRFIAQVEAIAINSDPNHND